MRGAATTLALCVHQRGEWPPGLTWQEMGKLSSKGQIFTFNVNQLTFLPAVVVNYIPPCQAVLCPVYRLKNTLL